ncbi:hypothetical protein GCM10009789_36260 [Kribbella sancticallisti]|uniref:Uncharacterized protein n=1 Tax=Kribbella sancticallisti TaxID=460087 RepID=A0ABP4PIH5_9ACTN
MKVGSCAATGVQEAQTPLGATDSSVHRGMPARNRRSLVSSADLRQWTRRHPDNGLHGYQFLDRLTEDGHLQSPSRAMAPARRRRTTTTPRTFSPSNGCRGSRALPASPQESVAVATGSTV